MKKMRRFAAIAAAAAMTACMAVPMMTSVFAADPVTVNITVESSKDVTASTSTFKAYRILDASISGTNFSYTVNDTFKSVLQDIVNGDDDTKTPTDKEITDYIDALDAGADAVENAAKVRAFADAVYAAIKTENIAETSTSEDGVFANQQQGYYLIVETTTETDDATDTFSLVMLDTAGEESLKVTTKEAAPSFQKKIMDANDSGAEENHDGTWRDSADYDIGDLVPFQLTATLPSNYGSYKEYKLVFHDDIKANSTGDEVFDTVSITRVYYDADGNGTFGGEDVNIDYALTNPSLDNCGNVEGFDCDFTVTIANLKAACGNAVANGKVVVEYTAKLNENAVMGVAGNWNGAYLEYSNNPYYEAGDDNDTTSNTPEEKVVAFTYQMDVNKVDGNGDELPGAGFTLYKWNGTEYAKVGNEITGVTTFNFKGIDAGKYKLVETKVPQGYTKAADIEFVVVATHTDETTSAPALTGLTVNDINGNIISGEGMTFAADTNAGKISTDVENLSGTELPSTGGIGTTLFYVIGGTLAAGAGVSLIAKKRMKNEE